MSIILNESLDFRTVSLEQHADGARLIACESPGPQIEAAFNTVHHGLSDGISTVRFAGVPTASRMMPALLSIR
jgi:hypothetical protein